MNWSSLPAKMVGIIAIVVTTLVALSIYELGWLMTILLSFMAVLVMIFARWYGMNFRK